MFYKRKLTPEKQYPNQPWKWRREWANGRDIFNPWRPFYLIGFCAFLWNLFFACILFSLSYHSQGALARQREQLLITVVFNAVGLLLIYFCYKKFQLARRLGIIELRYWQVPVSRVLKCELHFKGVASSRSIASAMADDLLVSLACTWHRWEREKVNMPVLGEMEVGEAQNHDEVLYQKTMRADRIAANSSSTLPQIVRCEFTLPEKRLNSTQGQVTAPIPITWKLEIEVPEFFATSFEVPVFSSTVYDDFAKTEAFTHRLRDESFDEVVDRANGVILRNTQDDIELLFSACPNRETRRIEWILLLLGVIFSIAVVLLEPFVGTLLFVICAACLATMIERATQTIRIETTSGGKLRWRKSSWFRTKEFEMDIVRAERIYSTRKWLGETFSDDRVVVKLTDGKELVLLDRMPSRFVAHTIAKRLNHAIST